jgi:hypothetical protein
MFKLNELVLGFLIATAIWIVVVALEARATGTLFRIEDCSAWITALATIAIALFTFTLWRSTDKLWKSGEKQFRLAKETSDRQAVAIQHQLDIAREANRAAQKSADAAVATERAWLYVVITEGNFLDCIEVARAQEKMHSIDDMPLGATANPRAKIAFKNYGKTPAIVITAGLAIAYSEGASPPNPVYDEKVIKENIIGPGQSTETFTEVMRLQMTLGQAKKVRDGGGTIWVAGYVSYDDVFGERRVHRFFQRLVCLMPRERYVLQAYDFRHHNESS